ncbi:MAG: MFS transporter [Fuerstiella sp.]
MNTDSPPGEPAAVSDLIPPDLSAATGVRHRVVAVSVLMAFILYLDRICLGEIVKSDSFNRDVSLSKEQIGDVLGAFFFTYALFQVPAGWLSDRFGARRMLTGYIFLWSALTALTGFMTGMLGLLLARLACGVAQAGAYPTSGAMIRRWVRLDGRGRASALVSFGGRLGGTLAPFLTTMLILSLGGWRVTLWLYGGVGILIAGVYWFVVRNRPAEHPDCNEQEQQLIGRPEDDRQPELNDMLTLLWACCTSRSLWLNSLAQFCINIGWAFLVTWLPTYLKEDQNVPDAKGAVMVSAVLAMGMLGQLIGGWATDNSVRKFGLRIGRVLPISSAHLIAGCAYVSCLWLDSVWGIIACCAVVSMMTDVANPSIWGFMQDVGGRNTGAVFGWANMWGNFGASASAIMVPKLLEYGKQDGSGQQMVFMACAGAFFIASLASLGMDATRPLETGKDHD